MKTLKRLLLIVVSLAILFVIIGFFLPGEIKVARSITIDAPIEMVYDQVDNLHNWEKWSPWHKLDTAMKITYHEGGIGKGAGYSWTSNQRNVGNGTLTITDAKPFEFINTQMDFDGHGTAEAHMKFMETKEGVLVTWDMYSDIGKNPIMHWMGLLMKSSIVQAYNRGLSDMDAECQYLQKGYWFYVKVKTKPAIKYYGLTAEVTMNEMQQTMEHFYGKLNQALAKNNIEINGAPFALYYSWGEKFTMECGLPVADNSRELKGIDAQELPETKYAVIKYTGNYDGLELAHQYMDKWLKQTGYEIAGPVMEKYKTDPTTEPDPNNWITYILYPLK